MGQRPRPRQSLPEFARIYDVTDGWRTFRQAPRRLLAAEDLLARLARTIVCSGVLTDRWRERYSVEASVLHNGIDVAAFTTAQPPALTGPGLHLGDVGTLHSERLDLAWVADLAQVGTVHLVGPSSLTQQEESRLRDAGVVLHRPVPSHEVASWMTSMDVLVSPHLVSDFTLSLDAIKSYEYLATGLPVVATPSSGFQLLTAPQLRVAPRGEFCSAVLALASGERFAPLLDSGWDRPSRCPACCDPASLPARSASLTERGDHAHPGRRRARDEGRPRPRPQQWAALPRG